MARIALLAASVVVLLAGVLPIAVVTTRWLGFDAEDRETTVFCASNKSLATGLPMAIAV